MKNILVRGLTCVVFLLLMWLPVIAFGANGDIDIFVGNAPVCGASIPCGESVTLKVYAILEGLSSGGITGVEYSVAIGPVSISFLGTSEDLAADGLLITEDFTPVTSLGGIVLGSAFTPDDPSTRGVNAAFPSCQTGDGNLFQ